MHHFNTARSRSRSMWHNSKEINDNELQIGFVSELQLRHNRDLHIMSKNSFSFYSFYFKGFVGFLRSYVSVLPVRYEKKSVTVTQ